MKIKNIAVVGLGYIGLPVALAFSKIYNVIGFDTNKDRIKQLKSGYDITNEISSKNLIKYKKIYYSSNTEDLENANVYIVAVPTPVNKNNLPDLKILKSATKLIAGKLKKDNIVIYESTVFPGATENICIPILKKISKLILNKDFFVGYSPERINPSDKKHTLQNVDKLVSATNKKSLNIIFNIYSKIIKAKVHKIKDIKTAESAKIIENIQRDVNIALINEFTQLFTKLNVNIYDVLIAAKTKWNFLDFSPGLVGGHCISVDPYYLTYKAKQIGYKPNIILSGRKINNLMPEFIFKKIVNQSKIQKLKLYKSNVLIMGASFKENCSDFRNNQSIIVKNYFYNKVKSVDIYDPLIDKKKFAQTYNFNLVNRLKLVNYDIILILVSHNIFLKMGIKEIKKYSKSKKIILDFKNIFPYEKNLLRL